MAFRTGAQYVFHSPYLKVHGHKSDEENFVNALPMTQSIDTGDHENEQNEHDQQRNIAR